MKMLNSCSLLLLLIVSTASTVSAAEGGHHAQASYDVLTQGTRELKGRDGSDFLKVLVEAASLGGDEVEIAEITFRPGYSGNGHPHGSIEIFYVLSGQLTHVVNGKGAQLTKGMVGIVRPGDIVEHINETEEPAKTLVIWVPGGEIKRSFGNAQMTPIDALVLEER